MIEKSVVKCRDLEFTCRHAGLSKSGDPVLLLHGFPQNSALWTELMELLVQKGHPCLAPDLRGYSEGARPLEVKLYQLNELIEDVLALASIFKFERFHLIGHDWGAFLGWNMAHNYPSKLFSWTSLSIPHVQSFLNALKSDPMQKKQSSYMFIFRLPFLPELLFTSAHHWMLRKMWRDVHPERVQCYLESVGSYAGMRAALNWYRANPLHQISLGLVKTPTLYIVGNKDLAVSKAAIDGSAQFINGPYKQVICQGGHWIVDESLAEIKDEILNHVAKNSSRT